MPTRLINARSVKFLFSAVCDSLVCVLGSKLAKWPLVTGKFPFALGEYNVPEGLQKYFSCELGCPRLLKPKS